MKKPRAPSSITITGAFDIECARWDQFACATMATDDTDAATWRTFTADALVDRLLSIGGTWWAWNGGRYDFLLVAEVLRRRGVGYGLSLSGTSVTRLQCGALTLCDAARLCPMPLDQAVQIAGMEALPALGWPCVCGMSCGGYCSITGRESLLRANELADYCARDTRACLRIVRALIDEAARANIVLRGTIGSTAWATAKARLNLPDATETVPPWVWKSAAAAYYGGRTCVGRIVAPAGLHHDLSSAYPSALARTMLPVGTPVQYGRALAAKAYARGTEGIYQARVRVPDSDYIPPLPVRHSQSARLGYPVGTFGGTWTGLELRAAEASGAVIERMISATAWDGAACFFAPLVEEWHERRMAHGKESAMGAWYRELSNASTGKLGENPNREAYLVHPKKVRICSPTDDNSIRAGCTRNRCTGRCGAYRSIDRWGEIWAAPYYRIGASAHVHWAAYLTSATRIAWRDGALAVGDAFVYGATDSVWSTGNAKPGVVGQAMGEWADKGEWFDWRCRAPNAYHYVEERTGEVHVRVAGASGISARDWRDGGTAPDHAIKARGVYTFRQAATGVGRAGGKSPRGLFARREMARQLPDSVDGWYGDRRWRPDGRVHPVTIEQLREHWRGKESTDRGGGAGA